MEREKSRKRRRPMQGYGKIRQARSRYECSIAVSLCAGRGEECGMLKCTCCDRVMGFKGHKWRSCTNSSTWCCTWVAGILLYSSKSLRTGSGRSGKSASLM